MANILLTDYCNQNCPYCFAKKMMDGGKNHISVENFKKAVDYLEANHVGRIGLIGGEPTLHPEFFRLLDYVMEKDLQVQLFTNGIMNKKTSAGLSGYDPDKVIILLNLNDGNSYSPRQVSSIEAALGGLNERIVLGYTICSADFSLEFHRDMVLRYDLVKKVRIGLASPIVGAEAENLYFRDDSSSLGQAIMDNVEELEKHDILVNFDCGFYMCMFTTEQLGVLAQKSVGFRSVCEPIIDIDMNLDTHYCFPFTNILKKNISDFPDIRDLRKYYASKLKTMKIFGNGGECLNCKYLNRGQCNGWCLGRIFNSEEGLLEKAQAAWEKQSSHASIME
jgi:MoaA/NifB/PqqE/SkfB family radical SAM enzyme